MWSVFTAQALFGLSHCFKTSKDPVALDHHGRRTECKCSVLDKKLGHPDHIVSDPVTRIESESTVNVRIDQSSFHVSLQYIRYLRF